MREVQYIGYTQILDTHRPMVLRQGYDWEHFTGPGQFPIHDPRALRVPVQSQTPCTGGVAHSLANPIP